MAWMTEPPSPVRECKRRSQRALTSRIRVKPQAKGFGS
jgi:hypothetical protein